MLPVHGKIKCDHCFNAGQSICEPHPMWRLRNDPGAWGSTNPEVLVLGFSKGSTQADIYQNGAFEDVAFGGRARDRLDLVLKSVGILLDDEHVNDYISSSDQNKLAFGSLVRCSLSRLDEKNGAWRTSGSLITKSFVEVPEILTRCSGKYLADLPSRTRIVTMLGVADVYIERCYELIRRLYSDVRRVNDVAYANGNVLFVHLTHPSPGNGTFRAWLDGSPKQLSASKVIAEYYLGGAQLADISLHKIRNRETTKLLQRPQSKSPEGDSEAARELLRKVFPYTEARTKYIACYTSKRGRQLAIERNRSNGYYLWSELFDPSFGDISIRNVKNPGQPYSPQQPRNSNLNGKTALRLKCGNPVFYLHVPTLKTLEEFVHWYAVQ